MQIDKPTFGLGTNTSVGASNGLAWYAPSDFSYPEINNHLWRSHFE
jgi:hypothetical protein